jgi:hypothetical protein
VVSPGDTRETACMGVLGDTYPRITFWKQRTFWLVETCKKNRSKKTSSSLQKNCGA